MEARIVLRQFSVKYENFTLAPLSIEFVAGERVAFIGPNGSGKTTTLRALAGRMDDYDGSILFDGHDLRDRLPLGRRRIGLLPESLAGYAWMRVGEHLEFLRQFYPDWDSRYAAHLVEKLRVPLDQFIGKLSKGTRVKVSYIAAESYRPQLLLLDEPTSGLDPEVRGELIDAIISSRDESAGRVVLFSTHILEDVELIAERVLLLNDGRLTMDVPVAQLRAAHGGSGVSRALYAMLSDANGDASC